MSDGREERKEQEARHRWDEENRSGISPDRTPDRKPESEANRPWDQDGHPERPDS